ncbi:MAG TPA: ABC transporter ATP-binding protein [Gemmatimonadales bacterium]|nr:ABC transporter ATP-binding protein [Gemmatimonadales bacterium]
MSDIEPGIEFDRVWKKFQRGERHDSLRDLIPATVRRLTGRALRRTELGQDQFWAVRDVSFEVRSGDVLGIIGRNGAGKSTILKTLTRILPPTLGRAEVRGRVGALIEIAAGFHQDLTGRENVFLQGAIMGMPKSLIRQRFDDIVAFAGIAPFIDTPVKRYSSGMNARLGFAIAAHLSPDVLIIDEVLAVGDFEFQQRAFGRMKELARSGIPVVVVSHQLDRIAELCTEALLMERGELKFAGPTSEAIERYLAVEQAPSNSDSPVVLESIRVATAGEVRSGGDVRVIVGGHVNGERATGREIVTLALRSLENGRMLSTVTTDHGEVSLPRTGPFELEFALEMNVPAGLYGLDSSVRLKEHRGDIASGPGAHLQVLEGRPFDGVVQTNAQVSLASSLAERAAPPLQPTRSGTA